MSYKRIFAIALLFLVPFIVFQNCTSFESTGEIKQIGGDNSGSCKSDEVLNTFGFCELSGPVSSEEPTFIRVVLMSGLSNPWDIAFLDDGTMFFTEKCLGLSVRKVSGEVVRLFGISGSVLVANDIFCLGQSGVHGVAVDPNFKSNRYIYVFTVSKLNTNPRTNRVVRLKVSSNYSSVSDRTDIVTDIPFKDQGNAVGGAGAHSGGRVRFGPDGYLYITTGDNHNASLPQSLTLLGGKVLRVDRNGNAAPNNSTPAGGDKRIYTYGHRNVQGIAFQPLSGIPFTAEHGPGHTDEVTQLIAGRNAGWDPRPDPGVNCPDGYCGYTTNKSTGVPTPMTDTLRYPNAISPLWTNDGDSAGMGPCEFIRGRSWKAWHGRLAVGIMGARRLDLLKLDSNNKLEDVDTLSLPSARLRSIVQAPDESIYISTDGGEIWKITAQ